jgi:hypothetical protein
MKITLGGNAQSTQGTSNQLSVGIHDVKFVSLTNETIEKKDGSAKFDVIKIKFEGAGDSAGKTFEHTVFEPRPGDDVRKANNYGYDNPSSTEEMGHLFTHLIDAVAAKSAAEIQKKGTVDLDGWDKIKAFMVQVTAKSVGAQTQIKLVPNKDGRGVFPSFVLGMAKDGTPYPRTNFIGKGLTFTANEMKQIAAKATAKPSAMDVVASPATGDGDLELNLDLV